MVSFAPWKSCHKAIVLAQYYGVSPTGFVSYESKPINRAKCTSDVWTVRTADSELAAREILREGKEATETAWGGLERSPQESSEDIRSDSCLIALDWIGLFGQPSAPVTTRGAADPIGRVIRKRSR
jgi:hypothetical protein